MVQEITILDGGMGQELFRRSGKPASPMWSAQVMLDQPESVIELHSDFIAAGAQVITLNAYAATPERLARDAEASLFEPLQRAALQAAETARGKATTPVMIAGCLPPLVASYHADVVPDDAQCLASYTRIVDLQAPGVDLFIAETMSCVREAALVCQVASATQKPIWISFTVDDGDGTKLRSGELLKSGAERAVDAGAQAILVNCSKPEAIDQAMEVLVACGVPFGGMANGFTSIAPLEAGGTVDALETRNDLGPIEYADHAMRWREQGATLIGGCCEVGPDHIAEIRQRVDAL